MSVPKHSLSIPNLVIILLKSQLLQFSMHSIHNFSLKSYYLKCLKSTLGTLVNISHMISIKHFKSTTFWILIQENGFFIVRWEVTLNIEKGNLFPP